MHAGVGVGGANVMQMCCGGAAGIGGVHGKWLRCGTERKWVWLTVRSFTHKLLFYSDPLNVAGCQRASFSVCPSKVSHPDSYNGCTLACLYTCLRACLLYLPRVVSPHFLLTLNFYFFLPHKGQYYVGFCIFLVVSLLCIFIMLTVQFITTSDIVLHCFNNEGV